MKDRETAGLQEVTRGGSNNATREAIRVREKCMTYFSTEGAVPWQPLNCHKLIKKEHDFHKYTMKCDNTHSVLILTADFNLVLVIVF